MEYACTHDPATDQTARDSNAWPADRRYWRHASRPFGNVGIAGTDAA
jgi:hypothetical protein